MYEMSLIETGLFIFFIYSWVLVVCVFVGIVLFHLNS